MEQQAPRLPDYESTPLSRQEYISAIVHLYRGELSRATSWRIRLDTTTNWAVLTTAGIFAFAFGEVNDHAHFAILIGMMLVTLLMGYEARRYQVFDVWRARVRKIEENFYGPILRRNPISPQREWGEQVARDLLQPTYKMSFLEALRARFLRNYWAIYVVLLLSWVLLLLIRTKDPHTWEMIVDYLEKAGLLPWWASFAYLAVLVVLIALLVFAVPRLPEREEDAFWTWTPAERPRRRRSAWDV